MASDRIERLSFITFLSIGAAFGNTAILHAIYTQLVPWLTVAGIYLLLIPPFFIGLLNLELRDTMFAMFATIPMTILLTGITRAFPAFFGIMAERAGFFVLSQFALTIPLIFPLVPSTVLGTLAGVLFNEFVIEPRTKD